MIIGAWNNIEFVLLQYELYRLQPLNNEEGSGPDLPHQTLDQSTPDLHGFVNQNLHN